MEFNETLKAAKKARAALEQRIADYKTEIAKLTQQGTSSGKEYWRKEVSSKTGEEKQILYIIYPMKDGKRRKEYIGVQEYKIAEAKARMERYEIRAQFIATLEKLETQLYMSDRKIQELMAILKDGNLYSYF